MKQMGTFKVIVNIPLTENVFKMVLKTDKEVSFLPGQFVNISIKNFYLRRPISVFNYEKNVIAIVYKIIGEGTKALSETKTGDEFDIMYPLGNGYTLKGKKPLLIGGGVGIPPLHLLAKKFIKEGIIPQVVAGFNTKDEIFCREEFLKLGINPVFTTIDGSFGEKGLVTSPLKKLDYDYVYCCGPVPMLKAVFDEVECKGQYSFEARMGCGFGACMGCSTKTKDGLKRICKDGPVLYSDEIIWD